MHAVRCSRVFFVGDRVLHWTSDVGVVLRVKNHSHGHKRKVKVQWDNGHVGWVKQYQVRAILPGGKVYVRPEDSGHNDITLSGNSTHAPLP